MSALIIVDIEVTDPVLYEEYKRLASASIAAHGGRYLVRGGASEVLDGGRHTLRRPQVPEIPTAQGSADCWIPAVD